MSKRKDSNDIVTGADKFESFLQRYFKHILFTVAGVIIIVIATYLVMDMRKSSEERKANYVGEAELTLNSPASAIEFANLSKVYSFMSDYINLVTSVFLITSDNKTEALQYLPKVSGNYKEFSEAIMVDLGQKVDMNRYLSKSSMPEVWYYKEILHADKDKQDILVKEFRSKYPNSKLLELIENWGI